MTYQMRGEAFLAGLTSRMSTLYVGNLNDQATTLGPVSSEKATTGLLKQIDGVIAAGAKAVIGGRRVERPGFYIEAALSANDDERSIL